MLNRLYIVVGVLAILAIAAAFIVPRFIQWGDYRDRMQAIAGEVLGAPVEIVGDIHFSLLPQPQLDFADVKVGDADHPTVTVGEVEAQFSLMDFLRDRYLVTKLVLRQPSVAVTVGPDGGIATGIALPERVTTSNISVASAEVVDGALVLADERSGERFEAADIDGELRMDALRGPFTFQGTGEYGGQSFSGRFATSALDEAGTAQLSLFVGPTDEAFTLSAEGLLTTAGTPSLDGTLTYRQAAPSLTAVEGEEEDAGRGAFVVTSKFRASSDRILLSEYTIVPDENRPATRLTGAADVQLGAGHKFNAVISGGVLALPPRNATADPASLPYEIIRLLNEIPPPPLPGLAGTLGVDIAEINLRAVSLRNVRFDATTDGSVWSLSSFSADLPGNTEVSLTGTLTVVEGRPEFSGGMTLATRRLDTFSQLWREAAPGNPLFNLPGALAAKLSLVGETLSLSDATLSIGEHTYPFSAEIGFAGASRHLNLQSALGSLDAAESVALAALLPDITGNGQFGVTFPRGKFDIAAEAANVAGLAGTNLEAAGSWEGGVLSLEHVGGKLGGVIFDARLTAFGSFAQPELSGTADIEVAAAGAPAIARLFEVVRAPPGVRAWLERSVPARLSVRLDAPSGEGGQGLGITGRVGVADMTLDAQLGLGVMRALGGKMSVELEMVSDDPAAFTAQLGLGSVSLLPEGQPMRLVAIVDGTALNSFETTVRVEGGAESLGFSGNVIAGNLDAISGNGTLKVALSDLSALTESLGAGGIWLPPLNGSARVDFTGPQRIRLDQISATSGGERITGALTLAMAGEEASVSGALEVGRIEPLALLGFLGGPAARLHTGTGYWPDGPLDVGRAPRTTNGRIEVSSPAIDLGGTSVTDATFDVTWNATSLRIRDFSGSVGGGTATADIGICCAGPLPQKQVSGRLTLDGVSSGSLVPEPVAATIDATVDSAARFSGTGDSLAAAVAAMTGEGSFTLTGLTVRGFSPGAFGSIATLEEVLDMQPGAVSDKVIDSLSGGDFHAPRVAGGFTMAGGVLRSPNLAIEGDGARLFGSTTIRLADLGLSGGFVMSPTEPTGPNGMLNDANAQIAANFAGTLPAPVRTFDVAGMVDTIMVRAYEIEVARLEQIRAEEEARAAAAKAERDRIAAEEAARKAAEEEAARQAAEAEAERKAAEEAEAARQAEAVRQAELARQAEEAEAARRAAEEAERPQLQPGFNLDFTPEQPANLF